MPWARFDDAWDDHPKVAQVGPLGQLLHAKAIIWAARNLSDGRVPRDRLHALAYSCFIGVEDRPEMLDALKLIEQVEGAGLIDPAKGGDYAVHDFLDYNKSRAEVEGERKAARERMRKARNSSRSPEHSAQFDLPRTRTKERSKERSKEEEAKASSSSEISISDAPLSHLLAHLIEENGSKRPPVGKRWAKAERLMFERDHRPRDEAERLIRWSQADEFWRSNILSMPKFREQYDKLRLQADRPTGGRSPASRVDRDIAELERMKSGPPELGMAT